MVEKLLFIAVRKPFTTTITKIKAKLKTAIFHELFNKNQLDPHHDKIFLNLLKEKEERRENDGNADGIHIIEEKSRLSEYSINSWGIMEKQQLPYRYRLLYIASIPDAKMPPVLVHILIVHMLIVSLSRAGKFFPDSTDSAPIIRYIFLVGVRGGNNNAGTVSFNYQLSPISIYTTSIKHMPAHRRRFDCVYSILRPTKVDHCKHVLDTPWFKRLGHHEEKEVHLSCIFQFLRHGYPILKRFRSLKKGVVE
eukprot:gene10424-7268_t